MTKDLLSLGMAMTRPSMSNYFSVCEIMDVILDEAEKEAAKEEKQWKSLLAFARKASEDLYHFQSKYALQSRVAKVIVDSHANAAVFLTALAEVSRMNLSNSFDQYQIIVTGLKQYAQDVPADNHRQAVRYLIAAGEELYDKSSAVKMYQSIMDKLLGLNFQTPAYRVVLRAGMDLSASQYLNDYDRLRLSRMACDFCLDELRMPPRAKAALEYGLDEVASSFSANAQKVRVLERYMKDALR